MSYKVFYGVILALCLSMGTIFLAGDSDDMVKFVFVKLLGLALYALACVLYMWVRADECEEQTESQG